MKTVISKGWCIEANGEIQTSQADIPYFWNNSEKEVAKEFMEGEYVADDKPRLVRVEMRRVSKRS